MSLFEARNVVTPEMLAAKQLQKVNQDFDYMLQTARNEYAAFWRVNEGVTPQEVVLAMDTSAQLFFGIAWARVQLLKQVAILVGKGDMVNEFDFLPPINVSFDEEGRAIIEEDPEEPDPEDGGGEEDPVEP